MLLARSMISIAVSVECKYSSAVDQPIRTHFSVIPEQQTPWVAQSRRNSQLASAAAIAKVPNSMELLNAFQELLTEENAI
jgi:hypothetical protein